MTPKHSTNAGTATSENIYDFKLIRGIGPAIEQRLHAADIYTFSQLAALKSEDLARILSNLAGLTPARIASMDWIGQARNLASEMEYAEPLETTPAIEDRQHYSTFTVELLLDEENNVRRTRVVHVQSGVEGAWAGWDQEQLVNLIRQSTHTALPKVLTEVTDQEEKQADIQALPGVLLSGELRLRELLAIKAQNNAVTRMLNYGQPYYLQLNLDLTDVVTASDIPLDYEATVLARDLIGKLRATIGVSSGTIQNQDHSIIYVHGKTLNRGIYRLDAVVTLSPQTGLLPQSRLMAMIEGYLIQVY